MTERPSSSSPSQAHSCLTHELDPTPGFEFDYAVTGAEGCVAWPLASPGAPVLEQKARGRAVVRGRLAVVRARAVDAQSSREQERAQGRRARCERPKEGRSLPPPLGEELRRSEGRSELQ